MEFTGHFVETMTKLANISFFESFELEAPVYPKLFNVMHINELGGMSYGQMTTIIGRGEPRRIGYAQAHDRRDTNEGYTAYWALRLLQDGFEVTQDMLRNWAANPRMAEAYVQRNSRSMGEAFAAARDRLCANVFNHGPLTAGNTTTFNGDKAGVQTDPNIGLIYDGKAFFDTDHPLNRDAATTFSNHTASRTLTEANLETTLTTMRVTNAKNEQNLEININPNVLVYNPSLDFTGRKILKSAQLPGTANNDINPVQNMLEPVPWAKITDTDAWFPGVARKGIHFIHNGDPIVKQNVDTSRGLGILQFDMLDEYTVVVDQWRYWYACNIAAA